jgi:nitroreductase
VDVIQAITSRRNIKRFKPDPIEEQKVLAWLKAASYAPNHRMSEPWEIYFVGPETRAKIGHKNNFGDAPVLLAIVSTPAKTPLDRDEHIEAVSCFIQNFMLAAQAEGVGTGWSSIGASPRVQDLLGLKAGYEVVGFLPVGYPAEIPPLKPRRDIAEKVHRLP